MQIKLNKKSFFPLAVLFLLVLIIFLINSIFLSPNGNIAAKLFTIEKGQPVKEIAQGLKKEGLIKDPYVFLFYSALSGKYSKIQAGEYLLSSQMSTAKILSLFTNGETAKEKLTLIEGWDLRDIAAYFQEKNISSKEDLYEITGTPTVTNKPIRLSSYAFLSDKPANLSLEGYLFPDTYYVDTTDTLESIIDKILTNFDSKLTPDLKAEIKRQNKTIFEIITMASIIEKEVKTPKDKKIVSGILWKRMKTGMRLQVDATVLYAQGKENSKVYIADTQIDSPYNTYRHDELPIGPISNPGLDSIIAAIYPTENTYYYYLSAPDGTTIFSKTLAEHNANKIKYLK